MKLKDKVAIVTGATSGIGKAIADRFAAEGAHVVINYRPRPGNEEKARTQAASYSIEALPVAGDVSQRADIESLVNQCVARFGRLDIAINNAGIEISRPFLEVTDEEWQKVIAVNLHGPFLLCQTAARQMVAQGGGGRILNISSVHEDIPFANYTPYCVSKGGIRMLMRNLALELAIHQINVNNIAPGAISTPINRKVLDDPELEAQALVEIPWGRFGKPEEVASLAAFLASDEAGYITGSTYYIDGGLTQQVTQY
jgi:glucose 1-dehydrogenase